jgi:hypothetical protein
MLRKLLIRTWIGPLPAWVDKWRENTASLSRYGYDFLLVNDYAFLRDLIEARLGITIADENMIAGTRKAGDFDPTYGVVFADRLAGYDYWGHVALDEVFGRIDRFLPDEILEECDIFSNDPGHICGPFTLYRNCDLVNNLFRKVDNWQALLSSPVMCGFDELNFDRAVQRAVSDREIRFKSAFWQAHDCQERHVPIPKVKLLPDGTLMDTAINREIMAFHFHRFRQWPVS